MFKQHQVKIEIYADESPDNLARVIGMVLLSIQQQWTTIGKQLEDLDRLGLDSKFLFGSKKAGWDYITSNKVVLYNYIQDYKQGKISIAEVLVELASIPGIAIVKAGFILQLTTGKVGCLDCHNLRRFDLSPNVFKVGKQISYNTFLKKASLYVIMCEKLGGSEYLWDSWCNALADKYPNTYKDGNEVSALHCKHLGIAA